MMAPIPADRRTFEFRNLNVTICGRPEDPYFSSLQIGSATNSVFLTALDLLPAGSIIFDVGANVGFTAVLGAAATAGTVYAFEPDPHVFRLLLATTEANSTLFIKPQNVALGAETGQMKFFANQVSGSASHLISGQTMAQTDGEAVGVMTLDRFVAGAGVSRVDMVKIDVEGFEIDVLQGGLVSMSKFRPFVLVEFNAFTMIAFKNINPRTFMSFLSATFPFIYRLVNERLVPIASENDQVSFIHDVLVGVGCVDDLLCSYEPIG